MEKRHGGEMRKYRKASRKRKRLKRPGICCRMKSVGRITVGSEEESEQSGG